MNARLCIRMCKRTGPVALTATGLLLAAGCASSKETRLANHMAQVEEIPMILPSEAVVGPLSLSDATERASAASEKIATLVGTVEVAAREKKVLRDLRDPELRLTYGQDEGEADRIRTSATIPGFETGNQMGTIEDELSAYSIGLRFYLPNPWTRKAQNDAGTAGIYAAIADVLQARWLMKHAVHRLYAEIGYFERDLEIVSELVEVYASARVIMDQLAEQGMAKPRDIMTTRSRYLSALGDRDETSRRADEARRELATLVAVPVAQLEIEPYENPFTPAKLTIEVIASLAQQAYEHRRDLAALHWRHVAAKAAYRAAKAERRPYFRFVQGSYGQSDSTMTRRMTATDVSALGVPQGVEEIVTHDDGSEDEWAISTGIIVPFPGFSGVPDLKLAELKRAELKESKARRRVKQEISNVVASVQSIATLRERHETDVVPLIEEMEKGLEAIEETALDAADMVRIRERILDAKRVKLESDLEYQLAIIELEEVLGLPLWQE